MPKNDIGVGGARVTVNTSPFQLRGRFMTAIALRLEDVPQDAAFYDELDAQLRQMPQFYANAPMILDLERTAGLTGEDELQQLAGNLRKRRLLVFGVQNASQLQGAAAARVGLIPVSNGKDNPIRSDQAKIPEKPGSPQNKMVTKPVRSGQTIVADGGDLIVVGPVSSGAELIARGNIHVYGRLRGRAMAGADGDENARIFCSSLDAELLAIAGLYQTNEQIKPEFLNSSVQVCLENGRLCMEELG